MLLWEYVANTRCLRFSRGMRPGTDDGCGAGAEAAGLCVLYPLARMARELRPLPGLLVVTPDPGQKQRIQHLAGTCAGVVVMVRMTTVSRLEQQGPLAPIWLTMLLNQQHPLRQPLLDAPRNWPTGLY